MKDYKYIFLTGAPGSKWSSVAKHIYFSSDIDQSDFSDDRTYFHDAPGTLQLMHLGAYFDPKMEFGDNFDRLDQFSKEELEREFDRPFNGSGKRIIKSHVFSHHLNFIRKTWPDCPIVTVERTDDSCLGWWVKCGHFNITYPKYDYYVDFKTMSSYIKKQNKDIKTFSDSASSYYLPIDNIQLAKLLHISPHDTKQVYADNDIKVKLFWN